MNRVICALFLVLVPAPAVYAQDAQSLTAEQQQKINDAAVKTKQAEADKAAADVKKADVDLEASKLANEKAVQDLSAQKAKDAVANLPNPDVKAPDGSLNVSDQSKLPENELLAYVSGRKVTEAIADELTRSDNTICSNQVAILRTADMDQIRAYRSFLQQLDVIKTVFEGPLDVATSLRTPAWVTRVIGPDPSPRAPTHSPLRSQSQLLEQFRLDRDMQNAKFSDLLGSVGSIGTALSVAQSIPKTTADIVALLQSKVTLAGADVSIKQDAVEGQLSRSLLAHDLYVRNPHLYPSLTAIGANSVLISKLKDVDQTNVAKKEIRDLDLFAADLQLKVDQKKQQWLKAGESDPPCVESSTEDGKSAKKCPANPNQTYVTAVQTRLDAYLAQVKAVEGDLNAAIDTMKSLRTQLTSASSGQSAPLATLLVAEAMSTDLTSVSCVIQVTPTSMGGGVMTVQNLWTFFGAPKIYHSGALAYTFFVFDPSSGLVKDSGVTPAMSGYIKLSQVRDTIEGTESKAAREKVGVALRTQPIKKKTYPPIQSNPAGHN